MEFMSISKNIYNRFYFVSSCLAMSIFLLRVSLDSNLRNARRDKNVSIAGSRRRKKETLGSSRAGGFFERRPPRVFADRAVPN